METINNFFAKVDDLIGPSKTKYKPACHEDKEIFFECVMESRCMKEKENFRYTINFYYILY